VEIQNTEEVHGKAVAVASHEAHNGSGRFDEWKRQRLLGVGADVVIPDFRDGEGLLGHILKHYVQVIFHQSLPMVSVFPISPSVRRGSGD
jgi:hypothetical protein